MSIPGFRREQLEMVISMSECTVLIIALQNTSCRIQRRIDTSATSSS